jgi:Ethanolamine utilization protein EutJ (predicted chaperonin)
MSREILEYTCSDDRTGAWEGTFEVTDNISVGNYILTHHRCRACLKPILQKVVEKRVAYYFQNQPVYDLIVEGGSSYKSSLKHISKFDKRILNCNND